MEKLIARVGYWLGIASLVIAVILKAANALGWWVPSSVTMRTISYLSFLHGSILFFVAAIATTCYAWMNSQKG